MITINPQLASNCLIIHLEDSKLREGQLILLFTLLESAHVKAARKMLVKSTPQVVFHCCSFSLSLKKLASSSKSFLKVCWDLRNFKLYVQNLDNLMVLFLNVPLVCSMQVDLFNTYITFEWSFVSRPFKVQSKFTKFIR